nr:MAG TPA: hypothetical protein [Caudoviricetes sp.]
MNLKNNNLIEKILRKAGRKNLFFDTLIVSERRIFNA